MHIFLTGATGFVGRHLIPELLAHQHTVLALSRSPSNTILLESLGCAVWPGDLEDIDSLRKGAAQCDAVMHLGFVHDFSRFEEVCRIDRGAVRALAEGLASGGGGGEGKALVVVSGTLGLKMPAGDEAAVEWSEEDEGLGPLSARAKTAKLVNRLAGEKGVGEGLGVRAMLVRLSPSVHGKGDKGFASLVIRKAVENGRSVFVEGAGAAWPECHVEDTAVLLRLAVEKGRAGAVYHALAEEGVLIEEFAKLVGRKLGVKVEGVGMEEAQKLLGWLAFPWAKTNYTSSELTRKELGWTPKQKGWLEDVEEHYFSEDALGVDLGWKH